MKNNKPIKLILFASVLITFSCSLWVGDKKIVGDTAATSLPATSTPLVAVDNTPVRTSIPPTLAARVTALRSLNVRESVGDDQPVVGALYSGNSVKLTGICIDGWAEIAWDGGTAWVNARYLSENKCSVK